MRLVPPTMARPVAVAAVVCAVLVVQTLNATAVSGVRVVPSQSARGKIDVEVVKGSAHAALRSIELHLGRRIAIATPSDARVVYRGIGVDPLAAASGVAAAASFRLVEHDGMLVVVDPAEPTLTIDVKDADLRTILAAVREQCGIRNVITDPGVEGRGTFLIRDVPCTAAVGTILRSLGLSARLEPNSVLIVSNDRR